MSHIRAVQPNRKRHWNQLVAMLDSSNSNGSEGSQVSLGWRPNGDGAANGSSTIVHRVLIDFSRQGGWRPEHRGRSREAIEMFDHDREVPSIDWRVHLVVPQQVPADVRIRKCGRRTPQGFMASPCAKGLVSRWRRNAT